MSLLDKIFKREGKKLTKTSLVNEQAFISSWSGNAYDNDIYRGAVDAIARNAGKLRGSHIVRISDHKRKEGDNRLNRILSTRWNPYMSAFDCQYKMVTHYYIYNNAFAFLDRDERGNVLAIYPITSKSVEMLSDLSGRLFCRFVLNSGNQVIFPYSDLIHLRRNFNSNELLGDSNSALDPALELAHTENEGAIQAIQTSANIRGILKYDQIMPDDMLKKARDQFKTDYLSTENDGGVITIDNKSTYTPIESKPILLNADQTAQVKTKIYNYLGISEKIVSSSYTEDEFSAFYESTIEPIATQLSEEFTHKIFNDREQAFGNEIVFEAGRLLFSSNQTKLGLIRDLVPMGLLTINQALEILNLPSIPDGDKRLQSLNYIDQEIAEAYQLELKKGDNQSVDKSLQSNEKQSEREENS